MDSTCLLSLVLLLTAVTHSTGADVSAFETQLKKIADDVLGVKPFQDYLDRSVTYEDSPLDAQATTQYVSQKLEATLRDRFDVVKRLKRAIEAQYSSYPTDSMTHAPDCCSVPLPQSANDHDFKRQVNRNMLCSGGAKRLVEPNHPKVYPDQSLRDAMKQNLEQVPTIKWQYFGTEDGALFNYPAFRFCGNTLNTYDPRFRPWYVQTMTPDYKEVVIVIDTSASMAESSGLRTLLSIAKEAAVTVVNTLNPNDSVGVVAFATLATTPTKIAEGDCYKDRLAKATPINRRALTEGFINRLGSNGDTAYIPALSKAFKYFATSPGFKSPQANVDKVILFLTDGRPGESKANIMDTIKTENAQLGNKVVIMTFAIGQAASPGSIAEDILGAMAKQANYDISAGEVKQGISKTITDPDNIRYELGTYYDFFSVIDVQESVVVSVPYVDAWDLGLVMSACMQVTVGGQVKGVTCVDIVVGDLLSDVTYFRPGELSYVFMVDGVGRLYVHPLLPQPSDVDDDPVFVDLEDVERGSDVQFVKNSMISGQSGSKTFASLMVRSRGDSPHEGVSHMSRQTTYTWQKVPQTEFSLCVVTRSGDRQAAVRWSGAYPKNFLFHRLDIYQRASRTASLQLCSHLSQIATKDQSAVFLSAGTFLESYQHLRTIESIQTIEKYASYFEGASDNPGFRESIRNTVAVTSKFDEITGFTTHDSALWAYIGTTDGVLRIIPASPYPQNFDPRVRPWFKRALSERGRVVFSAPYKDAGGAGIILTISHTIYQGKSTEQHTQTDLAVAVMGLDITLTYLYELVLRYNPRCNDTGQQCFLMDNSGYIVVHKDFIALSKSDAYKAEDVHIISKEPYIADKLHTSGQMTKEACINYEKIHTQYSWRVALTSNTWKHDDVNKKIEITEIEGTNLFLVMISNRRSKPYSTCSCRLGYAPELKQCLSLTSSAEEFTKCECPCYRKADYDACAAKFNKMNNLDSRPPCAPETPSSTFTEYDLWDLGDYVSSLERCKNSCYLLKERSACLNVNECGWCESLQLCRRTVYCSWTEGHIDAAETTPMSDPEGDPSPVGIIVGVVVGIIVLVAIIAVIVVCLRKRRAKPRFIPPDNERPSATAPHASHTHEPRAYGNMPNSSSNDNVAYLPGHGNVAYSPGQDNMTFSSQHIAPPSYGEVVGHPH